MRITQNSNYEIIKDLIVIAKGLDLTKENYLISYPHFINYFKNLERISLENMIIGISFTYSWMPTILKSMKLENTEKAIILLNKVKRGKILSVDELLILKETFNNSLVGSSKLLHFINPEKYANLGQPCV